MRGRYNRILPLILVLLLLCGCGSAASADRTAESEAAAQDTAQPEEPLVPYDAPDALYSEFHAEHASGEDGLQIDLEHVNEGYVTVRVVSSSRMKLKVAYGDDYYAYDLSTDGTVDTFTLPNGDGTYTFSLMQHVVDGKYAEIARYDVDVTFDDPFTPFLYPNSYAADYSADSECVALAQELASHESDEIGMISSIYDYICENITYDYDLAAGVEDGYTPDVDAVLASGKGICFDYAALAAAMLRSEGVPTKVVFGNVRNEDGTTTYHAWNVFYTEESGWVTVDFEVDTDTWNRMDLTYSAAGATESFVGDSSNYTDLYIF